MKLNRIRVVLAALALLPLVAGCGGSSSGGESPTAPPPMSSGSGSGSATIGGSVSTGATGSAVAAATARVNARATGTPSRAALDGDGLGAVTAADASGAGVVVSIQGTGIRVTADAQGRFQLNGVPGGNQLLLFEHAGNAAPLLIEAIEQQEAIDLDVTVSGSSVQVNDMTRSGGEEDEERTLDPAALSLQVSPDSWNLNYDNSQGTVEAFLRGEGFDLVDLGSIEMVGDGGGPLAALSATAQGNHVHARFAKNQVLDLLLDPAPGSIHTVIVTFMEVGGSERFALEAVIRVVGDEEEDDGEDDEGEDDEPIALTLEIQPDSWNTNWLRSNGTVSALIRGSGFERVDLDSIVLVGTDPAAGELAAERADAQGNHVRAFFAQSEAFLTLLDGDTGQTHVITIRFTVEGEPMELTDTIRTVGPAR